MSSWLVCVLATSLLCLSVQGQFTLEAMFHTYLNQNSDDIDGVTCVRPNGDMVCRNTFIVSTDLSTGETTFGRNSGGGRVTFTNSPDPNPIILSSPTPWPGSFQLSIVVENRDRTADIEVFTIPVSLSPSETFTNPTNFDGDFNNAEIELSFRVMCVDNYYGPNCSVSCVPAVTYTCNPETGAVECLEGFVDPSTFCTTRVTTMPPPTTEQTTRAAVAVTTATTSGVTTITTSGVTMATTSGVTMATMSGATMATTSAPGAANIGLSSGQVAGLVLGLLMIAVVISAAIIVLVVWLCTRHSRIYKLDTPATKQSMDNPNYEVVELESKRAPPPVQPAVSYDNIEFGRSVDNGNPLYSSLSEGDVYEVPISSAVAYEVPVDALNDDPDYCLPPDNDYPPPPTGLSPSANASGRDPVFQDTFDNPDYAEVVN